MENGEIVKLDRGFPLVKLADGSLIRCEHATALVKGDEMRAVIGDKVRIGFPDNHDKAIIEEIFPRTCALVRKDPTERALPQVLAANFDTVLVVQPLGDVNMRRLERELVLAFETGARVAVVLTKADLLDDEREVERIRAEVSAFVGRDVETLAVTIEDRASVERVRALVPAETVAVLIGKSGVGKSSLVNLLVGESVQDTGAVREVDGKGRHTTVSREMIDVPNGGRIVDMPGVRGLGLWDAETGIGTAFADIEEYAASCRFRDCRHRNEPGCAVLQAVADGEISEQRLESYRQLRQETASLQERREQARWMQGEKKRTPSRAMSSTTGRKQPRSGKKNGGKKR